MVRAGERGRWVQITELGTDTRVDLKPWKVFVFALALRAVNRPAQRLPTTMPNRRQCLARWRNTLSRTVMTCVLGTLTD